MQFSEDDIFKLADASRKSVLRNFVDHTVSMHFRSTHYMSSKLLSDCITLNLILNASVTPHSADKIITCMRRRNKSLYTTVDSAFFAVSDLFEKYAETVLGDRYSEIKSLALRSTNYIVFVISTDISTSRHIDGTEIFKRAFTYAELAEKHLS